jgi:LPS export ABC transporter permease LptG/LPS export ABC transporter permease LptF
VRILTRYILREVLSHALIGIALFTFVIFMRDVSRILELVVRNSAPIPSVAEIFFLTLPTAFTVTIPMGVLVGILIGLSRMASDSEITAMRASGIGSLYLVRAISIFAIAAWLLAMFNSVYVAPRSAAALTNLQNSLKNAQVSFEVQPRVFYEDFKNYVLYIQDSQPSDGSALWKNVFLADVSTPAAPKITVAQSAIVANQDKNTLRLHLMTGSEQETTPQDVEQYTVSSFDQTDIPIQLPPSDTATNPEFVPAGELKTSELLDRARHADPFRSRWYWIEFHRRIALASACLVLALVGIPLGSSSKKGGKSTGFVLTIVLVFIYYFASLAGVALARQGKVSAGLGVWSANILFGLAGLWLLRRVDYSTIDLISARAVWKSIKEHFHKTGKAWAEAVERPAPEAGFNSRFPQILDNYILREFIAYLGMVLASFIVLTLVFTFFELLGDIIRNRVPVVTVGQYLLNFVPSVAYLMAPLSVLVAVLVTFGLMQKSNELTAMKATGVSIYRAVIPVITIAAMVSVALFLFDQFYLPYANKRQDALRNSIKGKPAQTYLRPDRKWIFGEHNSIYYYSVFDPDRNRFGNISVFEFVPGSFQIRKRIFATRVHWEEDLDKWIFEQGWARTFRGDAIEDFKTFEVATFEELNESPQYFKKEIKQSSEMNFGELRTYIEDLQQSGFDVIRLRVQLHKKIAFPLITLVMALLAVPFALSAGKRGALTGVATAIGIAVVYWIVSGLFEAMGNVNQLPALLAAWSPDIIFALLGGYFLLKVPT